MTGGRYEGVGQAALEAMACRSNRSPDRRHEDLHGQPEGVVLRRRRNPSTVRGGEKTRVRSLGAAVVLVCITALGGCHHDDQSSAPPTASTSRGAASSAAANADLIAAAKRGDVAAVGALVARGADVNARDASGVTVLMAAAEQGQLDIVKTQNGILPQLDLVFSAGRTGYADSMRGSVSGDDAHG